MSIECRESDCLLFEVMAAITAAKNLIGFVKMLLGLNPISLKKFR